MNAEGNGHPTDATRESPLSAEYRWLMRWYPRPWRLANEEAMLGALLDQADGEGRDEVTAAERVLELLMGERVEPRRNWLIDSAGRVDQETIDA